MLLDPQVAAAATQLQDWLDDVMYGWTPDRPRTERAERAYVEITLTDVYQALAVGSFQLWDSENGCASETEDSTNNPNFEDLKTEFLKQVKELMPFMQAK